MTQTWLDDVRAALAVWRRTPILPMVAALLAILTFLPQLFFPQPNGCGIAGHPACTSGSRGLFTLLSVVELPAALFAVGFFGAERWWYAQVSSGNVPAGGQLWRVAWGYFWRFVRLGLLVSLISLPFVILYLSSLRNDTTRAAIAAGVWGFALDIALTFVTPALAFSTDSAWQALKTGVQTLDRLWPADLLYAVVPPLALSIVVRVVPGLLGSHAVTGLAGAVAQMLTMLFAGAIAIFYVREVDPSAPERLRDGPNKPRRGSGI
jgi:hypothetical protein